ncbi:cupin domain-containing protein [Rubellimicrobium roseum]|uniref:Cupin domain-containing protein n=1 Tax=Rubellimicrobium roseum TaxID=687525 RepID=A0A5C4NEW4_9RHOB|nr:cupin domain-containing protein [Rubellimicrobium roseum]TNC71636.1 cupin domain-containing protein [Rubellimicrobium roseum]
MKDIVERPRRGSVGPSQVSILATAEETGGRLGLVEIISPPLAGPPRHTHANEDEVIAVLDGAIEVWTPAGLTTLGAGESVFVPRGVEHAFRVLGEGPARILAVLTPGGFEGYFQGLLAGQLQMPRDRDAIAALGARFGQVITGGPL